MDACIEDISKLNDSGHHAISHIHASPPVDGRRGDEDGRFLAANGYDNILRVYDRRSKLISSSHGQEQMQLSFFVTGHKNKNWPIKSSFFRGEGYKYKLNLPSNRHTQRKLTEGDGEDFQDTYVFRSLGIWRVIHLIHELVLRSSTVIARIRRRRRCSSRRAVPTTRFTCTT